MTSTMPIAHTCTSLFPLYLSRILYRIYKLKSTKGLYKSFSFRLPIIAPHNLGEESAIVHIDMVIWHFYQVITVAIYPANLRIIWIGVFLWLFLILFRGEM